MGFIIAITVTLFFFIPYYLRIFLLDNKKTRKHILCWISVVGSIAIMEYIVYRQLELVSLFILVCMILYYFFTYICYVRNIDKKIDIDAIKYIVRLKYFKVIYCVLLVLFGVFVIIDILMIMFYYDLPMLMGCYLSLLIVIGYVQTVFYGKEYFRLI